MTGLAHTLAAMLSCFMLELPHFALMSVLWAALVGVSYLLQPLYAAAAPVTPASFVKLKLCC